MHSLPAPTVGVQKLHKGRDAVQILLNPQNTQMSAQS